jgi:hypothetical protein
MLTAQELGIKAWEYRELKRLYVLLKNDKVQLDMSNAIEEIKNKDSTLIDMDLKVKPYDCGTVACVGGHIGLAHGLTIKETKEYVQFSAESLLEDGMNTIQFGHSDPLRKLFYPENVSCEWEKISKKDTATAINNFLYGSNDPWKHIK